MPLQKTESTRTNCLHLLLISPGPDCVPPPFSGTCDPARFSRLASKTACHPSLPPPYSYPKSSPPPISHPDWVTGFDEALWPPRSPPPIPFTQLADIQAAASRESSPTSLVYFSPASSSFSSSGPPHTHTHTHTHTHSVTPALTHFSSPASMIVPPVEI